MRSPGKENESYNFLTKTYGIIDNNNNAKLVSKYRNCDA